MNKFRPDWAAGVALWSIPLILAHGLNVQLESVAPDFDSPVFMTDARDGSGR